MNFWRCFAIRLARLLGLRLVLALVIWPSVVNAEQSQLLTTPEAHLITRVQSPEAAAINTCRSAIKAAEVSYKIPVGLLLAIGQTESGRRDPSTGQVQPWPWTVNAGGRGRQFDSATEAIEYVHSSLRDGITSIDTGCLQVNLEQHPLAFQSLDEAFDVNTNANYAARFLSKLYAQSGDWGQAVGDYHSKTVLLGQTYRSAVQLHLIGLTVSPHPPAVVTDAKSLARTMTLDALQAAWSATLPSSQTPTDTLD